MQKKPNILHMIAAISIIIYAILMMAWITDGILNNTGATDLDYLFIVFITIGILYILTGVSIIINLPKISIIFSVIALCMILPIGYGFCTGSSGIWFSLIVLIIMPILILIYTIKLKWFNTTDRSPPPRTM